MRQFGREYQTETLFFDEGVSVDLSSVTHHHVDQQYQQEDGVILSFFNVFCGRGKEKLALVKAYQKCRSGKTSSNPIFVRGPSGVGKTALVRNALRDLVTSTGGYFVEGKWDQVQSKEPYAALVAALSDLCDLICQDGVPETTQEALAPGTEGHLLSVLLPRVEIFGRPQADVNFLEATSSLETTTTISTSTRLQHAFRAFLEAVGSREHPVVLFLDDIQWSPEGSVDLIKMLAAPDRQSPNVLLVMAYREDDTDSWRAQEIVDSALHHHHQDDTNERILHVGNLDESAINQMLSMMLHSDPSRTRGLSQRVLAKTGGNALFVKQFLVKLVDAGLASYDGKTQKWAWDVDEIQQRTDVTENVADLINQNLQSLSEHVRTVLEKASFLGHKIDVSVLNKVVLSLQQVEIDDIRTREGHSTNDAAAARIIHCLEQARKEGFVERIDQHTYKFNHDRIQQCLYDAVVGTDERARLHAMIGRVLLDKRPDNKRNVFVIADHMNRGMQAFCESVYDLRRLADVNREAANEAIVKSDFHSALHYAERGIEGLQASSEMSEWGEESYVLRLGLGNAACEASLSLCSVDKCESHANEVIAHSKTLNDRLLSMERLVLVNAGGRNNLSRGIDVGLGILDDLGFHLRTKSPSPLRLLMQISKIRKMLRKLGEEGFIGMPLMEDKKSMAACRVFGFVGLYASAESVNQVLSTLCFLGSLRLSLENGFCPTATPTSLAMYALVEKMLGNMGRALDLAELALKVQATRGHESGQARTLALSHSLILHWRKPIIETVEPHRVALYSGLRHGDLEFGVLSLAGYSASKYRAGFNLETVSTEVKDMHDMVLRDYNQAVTLLWTYPYLQVLFVLMGETEDTTKLSGEIMNEEDYLRTAEECGNLQLAPLFYALKIELAVLFESCLAMELALDRFAKTKTKQFSHLSVNACFTHCFRGLASLRLYGETKRRKYWSLFLKSTKALKQVDSCTSKPMYLLLVAERASYKALRRNNDDETVALFEKAVQSARSSGFIHFEALATERAGAYCIKRRVKIRCLRRAKELYREWGAFAKVESLERKVRLLYDGEDSDA